MCHPSGKNSNIINIGHTALEIFKCLLNVWNFAFHVMHWHLLWTELKFEFILKFVWVCIEFCFSCRPTWSNSMNYVKKNFNWFEVYVK